MNNIADKQEKGERIAKVIARSGICSRREAEKIIEEGGVTVNGKRIASSALNVTAEDVIMVRGKRVTQAEEARLWLYYKPLGLVTTHKDEKGRTTVFETLPRHLPRLISVGRLDLNTEGLLLLTNDGGLSRFMELPSTGWKRRYRARVYGTILPESLEKLARGVTVDGVKYGSVEVSVEKREGTSRNSWVMVTLTEGKNREIRKIFEHIGCQVSRLIRLSYGPFQLGNLKPGEIKEVPRKALLEQLGNYIRKTDS
ncbi:MAG TPA: pseudouridine synthase [Rickettsiales bacterium]|nr:pseudouridine synthase [Rickettsiales bacterium]